MFLALYLVALAISAAPFLLALNRAREDEEWSHHTHQGLWRRSYYFIGTLVIILILETWGFRIAADSLWFEELHQSARYWSQLTYELSIFGVAWAVFFSFVGTNLWLLTRSRAVMHIPASAGWWVASVVTFPLAFLASGLWQPVIAYMGSDTVGQADPVFGLDVSFYLFSLPLFRMVLHAVMSVNFAVIIVWASATLLYWRYPALKEVLLANAMARSSRSRRVRPRNADEEQWEAEQKDAEAVWNHWAIQGACLLGFFCFLNAIGIYLDRYVLVQGGSSDVVPGAAFIDVVWVMPTYVFAAYTWLLLAAVLFAAAMSQNLRRGFMRMGDYGIWRFVPTRFAVTVAIILGVRLLASFVPAIVQQMYVKPNEITLEQPYLVDGIKATREAFNLAAPAVVNREFTVSKKPLTHEDFVEHADILRDARIWDWDELHKQLQQDQGLRPYYLFGSVDIDRYMVGGVERQVMIAAREMNVEGLPAQSQVWVNKSIKYTHGYGVAAAPVNEHDANGNPSLWAYNIPVIASGELAVTHPQIYFGESTTNAVYVNTTEKEFDRPNGDANIESNYDGKGGIVLSDLWRKFVFAHELDGMKLFFSDYFTPKSRVLWRRDVAERVSRLAPFLHYDDDAYIVAGGDHYYWIRDAYAVSSHYPYSEAYNGSLSDYHDYNYIRNSVKTVVDAYDGSVTFYVFDSKDPIVAAYRRMFPGLFKDASAMPASLRRHIRYPEALFKVQTEMYEKFHMTNPFTFYNGEDQWDTPNELHGDQEQPLEPYYVTTELPESTHPEFMLMQPFVVHGKNQMAGWLAGLSDGDNYGKLVAYTFPKGVFIDGPAQVESRISSQDEMSQKLTLWNQQGSHVVRGNLLILPFGNSLVTLEPVYIESTETKIPQLTRVIFGQLMPDNRNIVWASTLSGAQDILVGALRESIAPPTGSPIGTTPLIEKIRKDFSDMSAAFSSGDYETAGKKLQEIKMLLGQK